MLAGAPARVASPGAGQSGGRVLLEWLAGQPAAAPPGALILMLGAGSISSAARRFGAALAAPPVAAG